MTQNIHLLYLISALIGSGAACLYGEKQGHHPEELGCRRGWQLPALLSPMQRMQQGEEGLPAAGAGQALSPS
ncbi:hypothetical protein AV530_017268 [Patagioenas fasciata monilis]|uniref:Uncharacterized protein n=1 Tax=Patagioenas fasciata monilis TaxID=372326 RepID=A0A1V4JFI0_PATFA|nr:hypothetical protein AV530_017268 [Patagioenas fasciata monilis]